jgi:predicted nucleotidyltransferase
VLQSCGMEAVRRLLAQDRRVLYALVFGSGARGTMQARSDLDIAVELAAGVHLGPGELGDLVSSLEHASGRSVDLVVLDEAPPAVAYRVFRDGQLLVVKDRSSFVERKTGVILEYLDFRPLEELAARGVVAAAAHGR